MARSRRAHPQYAPFSKHEAIPLPLLNTSANPVFNPFSLPVPGPFPYLYHRIPYLNIPNLKPVPDSNQIKPASISNPNPVSIPNPAPDNDTVLKPAAINSVPEPAAINSVPEPAAINSIPEPGAINSVPEPAAINSVPEPDAINSLPEPDAINSIPEADAINSLPEPAINTVPVPRRRTRWWSCCGLCDFWRVDED